ncbi:hypothetical protein BJ878DRAFT_417964 [Calycina marina]|uniref:Uncharacterized protein n=1 Tax=Calycina marina TaxID=1763456 RepID=A0A9P7Z668_9HELO|nr:hypothetical protein BJ878DRAFT_417964 [Calycina marina]
MGGTTSHSNSDELLRLCWSTLDSWSCVGKKPCSWCPTSSTCVPNTARIPILAPIWNLDICPLWYERWELRARPFGPHVSTITFLTCIVSVISTFIVIGLVVAAARAFRALRKRWKGRKEGWWKVPMPVLVDRIDPEERRRLLG